MTQSLPNLNWRAFTAPKAGGVLSELEDAHAGDVQAGRFAVADGASESAFAAAWADLLVERYVANGGRWSNWLLPARQTWEQQCRQPDLPWYLEEKLAEGAFATLLGVSFRSPRQLQAAAVGDCCLFHVRGNVLRRAFPIERSQDFGLRPALLCSRRSLANEKTKRCQLRCDWRRRDLLLLATDALAQWFLKRAEDGATPWTECLELASQEQFDAWMMRLRNDKLIRNDDATLMVIGCESQRG